MDKIMRQLLLLSLIYIRYGYLKQGNQCDNQTGTCLSDVQCDPEWMGSSCQQVNIAYNVAVRSYHCDQGLTVVDGRESTCATFTSQSGDPAFLVLDLGRNVNILEVDLVNPNASGDSLLKFGISLSQDNVTFKPYYWYQSTGFSVITEPSLKSDIIARFVRIEPNKTEPISTLCEIEITGECDNFYGNCSTPCGHCASGEQCNKVTGHCDVSGCAVGWQTVKCDKNISALKEQVNVGIIAGTVSAFVGVIIVIVMSVVIAKTRRRRETTEKEKGTSSQKVDNIEHDISKAYYNTDDSRTQRSEPIHTTKINVVKRGPDVSLHSGYEKLRDRMGTEELSYSVIDHGLTDNNVRSTLENTIYYNEEVSSPEER